MHDFALPNTLTKTAASRLMRSVLQSLSRGLLRCLLQGRLRDPLRDPLRGLLPERLQSWQQSLCQTRLSDRLPDGLPARLPALTPLCIATILCMGALPARADETPFIIVQSTTSTQNSGLYEAILPVFENHSGVDVRVVAVGTGQALKNAENCDGDVLLVHAKAAEEAFVEAGYGVERTDVMFNDFVIIGPAADPAGIAGLRDVEPALERIAATESVFVSRGDDSGTHKAEMRLWDAARLDPVASSGSWYRETGSGMGATLNVAAGMDGYALTDRATWISFGNKAGADVLVEGDAALFNQYGVILVNPERCDNIKADPAQQFIDWLLSDAGQAAIAGHTVDGQQLFFPNAPPTAP